jgi:class 3 adenylate cyclase/tetratricopeptide (TPR) repeat protein
MRCAGCGVDSRPGARFCEECGSRLDALCLSCGAAVLPDRRFCGACGHPLTASPRPSEPEISPESYTPRHLAEQILTSRVALEGERKQVTVLFADVRGSLEMMADRDPEEARRLLDPIVSAMMDAVHRHEGTVNQVLGDGIMALFGAPLAHEDHAVRACLAALDMQEAVEGMATSLGPRLGVELRIRIGLNSGEVVVRSLGSDLRMDYTAVGQTTHLAGRMEQMARPGSILLTATTRRLAGAYVEANPLGATAVKGLTDPVDTFELIGRGRVRTRLQASQSRGLTLFVGRESELAELRRAAERAAAGHGQIVAVVGEPGIGKSRLVAEFVEAHLPSDWLILETGTVSHGHPAAALLVIALLRSYFEIPDDVTPEHVRDAVMDRLRKVDPALESIAQPILVLLGAGADDPAWAALEPAQRRRRTFEAVVRVLVRQAQMRRLCLVIEDLQWIDPESQALVDRLVESLPAAHILVLFTYRPEYRHSWSSRSYYAQLPIYPLPERVAGELLEDLLGKALDLAPLKAQLIERTDGNPLFLEEGVWNLVETQALLGERGAYRLAQARASLPVPPSVQAVLAARIDRLPAEHKRLLQCASVIGKDVPMTLLELVTDLRGSALREGISRLQAAEFVHEVTLFPSPSYTFRHALTHEVAYGSLLGDRRKALDALLVAEIERVHADHLDEHTERLAHHAFRGEVWDKAMHYCREAGARAFARSAHRIAVDFFERALAALTHLPASRGAGEQGVDVRLDLRYALMPLGEFQRVFDYLSEAGDLARACHDQRRLGLVSAFLTNYFHLMGRLEEAVAHGERAVEIARDTGDLAVGTLANAYLGLTHYTRGDYGQAVVVARRNVTSLIGPSMFQRFGSASLPSVYSRTCLAWSLAELGDFSEAGRVAAEGLQIAEKAGHSFSLIYGHLGQGTVALRRGDLANAVTSLDRALKLCIDGEVPLLFSVVAISLTAAYARSGRTQDALRVIDEGGRLAASIGDPVEGRWRAEALSETYLRAGRAKEALPLARRNVEKRRSLKTHGYEAWALWLLGEVTAAQDPVEAEEAESSYRAALLVAGDLGMRPLVAHCRLGLGTLLGHLDQREHALVELNQARDLFQELDMTACAGRAQAEIAVAARSRPREGGGRARRSE